MRDLVVLLLEESLGSAAGVVGLSFYRHGACTKQQVVENTSQEFALGQATKIKGVVDPRTCVAVLGQMVDKGFVEVVPRGVRRVLDESQEMKSEIEWAKMVRAQKQASRKQTNVAQVRLVENAAEQERGFKVKSDLAHHIKDKKAILAAEMYVLSGSRLCLFLLYKLNTHTQHTHIYILQII